MDLCGICRDVNKTKCNHYFHIKCLRPWAEKHNTMCRKEIFETFRLKRLGLDHFI